MPSIELKYTFDNEDELRAHLAAETETKSDTPSEKTVETETKSEPEIDSDGMPWDEEIHSGGKALNKDGTWKARQGKADEAKKAREEFKSGGGNEEAPTDLPNTEEKQETPVGLPGMENLPDDAPEPVALKDFTDKVNSMIERKTFDADVWKAVNAENDITDPNTQLATNETARAAVYAKLCEIDTVE